MGLSTTVFRTAACAAILALVSPAAAQQAPANPPTVVVATVEIANVAPVYDFVGRVEATDTVDIRARVEGFLKSVLFTEGQAVEVGQPLIQIEANRYEAFVKAARGTVAQAQARLDRARLEVERIEPLAKKGVASQAKLDDAVAEQSTAQAEVLSAQAELDGRLIDLADTEIVSPIAGRIGRSEITVGNLVTGPTEKLARIVAMDPIRVVFSVSEDRFVATRREFGEAMPLEELSLRFTPRVRLADGSLYDYTGRIEFIDNEVDPNTGTIAIRALFDNPHGLLLPGQFVNVTVTRGAANFAPVVPHRAVQQDRSGQFVLVVDEGNVVIERRVTLGANTGDGWAVTDGLADGERVIVDGFQKATPGAPVTPVAQPEQPAS